MNRKHNVGTVFNKIICMILLIIMVTATGGYPTLAYDDPIGLTYTGENSNSADEALGINTTTSVTITTPGNKTINALKYTGSSNPGNYPNISNYPSASLVYASSNYYNCFGFALYFCGVTTGISNAKAFWIESAAVSTFLTHNCFSVVSATSGGVPCNQLVQYAYRQYLSVGDVVIYHGNGSDSPINMHGGVITSISPSAITIVSKWGKWAVYSHNVDDCLYATTFDTSGTLIYTPVTVYHRTHGVMDNSIIPTQTSATAYTLPSYVTIDMNSHKKMCNCGRSYTVMAHTYVSIGGERYQCVYCGQITDSYSPNKNNSNE